LKFADDSKLWGSANTEEYKIKIQNDLNILSDWAKINHMPFNVSKCKVLHIGNKNNRADYKLMEQNITETTEEKDLGAYFTNTFKSRLNCSKVQKSSNNIMGLIRRNVLNKSVNFV